jgi:hypothetical protein
MREHTKSRRGCLQCKQRKIKASDPLSTMKTLTGLAT